jgi:hypothetical protein
MGGDIEYIRQYLTDTPVERHTELGVGLVGGP